MKVIKTASGKNRIKMSRKEWASIGKKAGWIKEAGGEIDMYVNRILGDEKMNDVMDEVPDDIKDDVLKALREKDEEGPDKEAKKGLWENIHNKRKRGEKPARPGDEDYPDKDSWEKAKKSSNDELSLIRLAAAFDGLVVEAAEYKGKKVQLNKPMRGDVKKYKVYVKNDKGNVVKVNFGDKNMEIKRDDPERRKSFRARHNCDNPGPKWKARYWSCKFWSTKSVSDLLKG